MVSRNQSPCPRYLSQKLFLYSLIAGVPKILVGTKLDLRDNPAELERLRSRNQRPVTAAQGDAMRKKISALSYKECSALTQAGLKDIFDEAIKVVLFPEQQKKKKPKCIIL